MNLCQELDKWAYDIEQQLINGNYNNRVKLQKKYMNITNIRDRYSKLIDAPLDRKICRERLLEIDPRGIIKPEPMKTQTVRRS